MAAPIFHLIIPGLPKSANVFVQRTMELTLGCKFVRFVSPQQQILPDKFEEFWAQERAVGGQHFPPNEHNLRLLADRNVRRVAVLVRDPRDAIISAWHHLERQDIRADGTAQRLAAEAGAMNPNYYDLEPQERLRDLVVNLFPLLQGWIVSWINLADRSTALECHINRYETFVTDQRSALRSMLEFFGHDVDPVFPAVDDKRGAGVDMQTHFRRGEVGSYRDEAPPELVKLLDETIDRSLAARMGWT